MGKLSFKIDILYADYGGGSQFIHGVPLIDPWIEIDENDLKGRSISCHEYGHYFFHQICGGSPDTDCPSPHYWTTWENGCCAYWEGLASFYAIAVHPIPLPDKGTHHYYNDATYYYNYWPGEPTSDVFIERWLIRDNYCPIKIKKDEDFRVFIVILVLKLNHSQLRSYITMSYTPIVLAQIVRQASRLEFSSCVKDNHGDKYVKSLFSWNLFILLVFAHLAEAKSMRHLVLIFNSASTKLYHLGCKKISLNTLSNALAQRPSNVYRDFFYALLSKIPRKKTKIGRNFNKFVSIVDATCMPMKGHGTEWAKGGKSRQEARAHVLIDASGMRRSIWSFPALRCTR